MRMSTAQEIDIATILDKTIVIYLNAAVRTMKQAFDYYDDGNKRSGDMMAHEAQRCFIHANNTKELMVTDGIHRAFYYHMLNS